MTKKYSTVQSNKPLVFPFPLAQQQEAEILRQDLQILFAISVYIVFITNVVVI